MEKHKCSITFVFLLIILPYSYPNSDDCKRGFWGINCSNIDGCYENGYMCLNGSTCIPDEKGGFICECAEGFEGKYCNIVNLCLVSHNSSNPSLKNYCKNKGDCHAIKTNPPYKYKCICDHTGFTGDRCQFKKGRIELLAPSRVQVGVRQLFRVIVLEKGDKPRFFVRDLDGFEFEFLSSKLTPLSENDVDKRHRYPPGTLVYTFWYTFTNIGNFNARAYVTNGGTEEKKIKGRNLPSGVTTLMSGNSGNAKKVSAILPKALTNLPAARLTNVALTKRSSTMYERKERIVVSLALRYGDKFVKSNLDYRWTLHHLDENYPTAVPENELNYLVKTDKKYVVFEPYALPQPGNYLIIVELQVHDTVYKNFREGYFTIIPSNPKIVIKGGDIRTVNVSNPIVISASSSIDVTFPEKSGQLQFNWTCPQLGSNWIRRRANFTLSPGTLTIDTSYVFNVEVTSNSTNTKSTLTQTIFTSFLDLTIECSKNCDRQILPGDTIFVECSCPLCPPGQKLDFHWEPQQNVEIFVSEPGTAAVVAPDFQKNLQSPANLFCSTQWKGVKQQAELSFYRTLPPDPGTCSISPTSGAYLVDTFTISCSDISTDNSHNHYAFYAKVSGAATEPLGNKLLLFYDTNNHADEIFLPFGNEKDDELHVIVEISHDGVTSELDLKVKVSPPNNATTYLNLIDDLVLNNDSKLKLLLQNGYVQETLHLHLIILYGLLSEYSTWDPIAILKKGNKLNPIVNEFSSEISKIPLNSPYAIMQVTSALHLLAELKTKLEVEETDVNVYQDGEYLKATSLSILEVASTFKNFVQEGSEMSAQEIDSMGMVMTHTASQILKISNDRGQYILTQSPVHYQNKRDVIDYDLSDDFSREYFFEAHPAPSEWDNNQMDDIEDVSSKEIRNLAAYSRNAYLALEYTLDAVTKRRVPSQPPFVFSDSNLAVHSDVQQTANIRDKEYHLQRTGAPGPTLVKIPRNFEQNDEKDIEIQLREVSENVFFDDMSALPGSPIVSVIIKDSESQQSLPVVDSLGPPIEIDLPLKLADSNDLLTAKTEYTVTVKNLQDLKEDIPTHRFTLTYNMKLEVTIADYDPDPNFEYILVFVKDEKPNAHHFCDPKFTISLPHQNLYATILETEAPPLDNEKNSTNTTEEMFLEYYVAIWVKYNGAKRIGTETMFSVYFTRASCLARNENRKFWSEEGCIAHHNPMERSVHCTCNHLSVFTATQFILPNDFQSLSLVNIDLNELRRNSIVLITVCTSLAIYIILMVICWFWDRREDRKYIPITVMADLSDDFEDAYYLITVFTGTRVDAGTTANVCLQIIGSKGRSKIYILKENSVSRCARGDIDTYLVSSPFHLGDLEKIRLWHDNTGSSPSWYCDKVIIRDIKQAAHIESYFFVEEWLTVCYNNPKLEYYKLVATEKDKRSYCRRFRDKMANDFNSIHLWFSVLTRPPTSTFTRCQRLSCAYSIFCFYMLHTIMFYGIPTDDISSQLEVGGFTINLHSLILWLQNIFLALPVAFLITFLFQKLREHYIPTLIIWKNKTKPLKASAVDQSTFIPKRPPPTHFSHVHTHGHGDAPILDIENGGYDSGSDSASTFSLPSTDIKEVEGWVLQQTEGSGLHSYENREPDSFIHMVNEKKEAGRESMDKLDRLGRQALVNSVRYCDPDSFIFSGDNDIIGVEHLIDEELRNQAAAEKGGGDHHKHKRNTPWSNLKTKDLAFLEEDLKINAIPEGIVTAAEKKEPLKGLAIELCYMAPMRKQCGYLPWFFVFLAWVVCLALIVACSYFTILYGISYGYLKSLDWLIAVISSTLISIFIVQPIKIIIVSALYSLCTKEIAKVHQDRFQLILCEGDEEFKRIPHRIDVFQPEHNHPPLSREEVYLLKAKSRRKYELRTKLLYLILYCILLCPVTYIAHSSHSEHSYRLTENVRNMFKLNEEHKLFDKTRDQAFLNIRNEDSLLGYLRQTFIPAMHPTRRYNNEPITTKRFEAAYLGDDTSLLVGVARIRQLRMPKRPCKVQDTKGNSSTKYCIDNYYISTQDTKSYKTLWAPLKGKSYLSMNDIWKFRPQKEVKSLPLVGRMGYYDGGGYVAELGRTRRESISVLKYLQRTKWLDKNTRAIFIEFGTFTPSLNLFTNVILMIEIGGSQGMRVTSYIYPMVILHPNFNNSDNSDSATPLAICLILTLIMMLVLTAVLLYKILFDTAGKILSRFWFWIDFPVIVALLGSLYLAEKTNVVMMRIAKNVESMLINEYVSLQSAALWDQIQCASFAVVQIMCFLRICNILIFSSEKFMMLTLTLRLTAASLLALGVLFGVFLSGFALSGLSLFGSSLHSFHNIQDAFVTLTHQVLDEHIYEDIENVDEIIGPAYFVAYGFVIVVITLNLFIALINDGLLNSKRITAERRQWLTLWDYLNELYTSKGDIQKKLKQMTGEIPYEEGLNIMPDRLQRMKNITARYIWNKIHSRDECAVENVKRYTDLMLKGTGYRMVSIREGKERGQRIMEAKMEQMRLITVKFFKAVLDQRKPEPVH